MTNFLLFFSVGAGACEDDRSFLVTAAWGGPRSHSFLRVRIPDLLTGAGACDTGGDDGGDGGPLGGGVAHVGDVLVWHKVVGGTPTILGSIVPVPFPSLLPRHGGVAVPLVPLFLPEPLGE